MRKEVKYAVVVFILFIVALEVGLRIVYFQTKARSPLAVITTFRTAKNMYLRRKAQKSKVAYNIPPHAYQEFWNETGKEIRTQFFRRYSEYFEQLAEAVESINSRLVVLYIPSGLTWENDIALVQCRTFFRELTNARGVEYCDMTDIFRSHPIEAVTLLPTDGHMSRFGNKLVADQLQIVLSKYDGYKSSYTFDQRPSLLGDLEPEHNEIWEYNPRLLYRVVTNGQGLRNKENATFPKTKQRILCLGDSQTFGVFLDNALTYTGILNERFENKEFFNAAKSGYGIIEEYGLFQERAKYMEPDVTVLQVLDNDIYGMFYFKRSAFNRKNARIDPTDLELEFLSKVRKKAANP